MTEACRDIYGHIGPLILTVLTVAKSRVRCAFTVKIESRILTLHDQPFRKKIASVLSSIYPFLSSVFGLDAAIGTLSRSDQMLNALPFGLNGTAIKAESQREYMVIANSKTQKRTTC